MQVERINDAGFSSYASAISNQDVFRKPNIANSPGDSNKFVNHEIGWDGIEDELIRVERVGEIRNDGYVIISTMKESFSGYNDSIHRAFLTEDLSVVNNSATGSANAGAFKGGFNSEESVDIRV